MGVSAGGYASILFGSLCNITHVISFIPRTNYHNKMIHSKYFNLKNIINNNTNYILYGDLSVKNINDNHHISQCDNLKDFNNVNIIKYNNLDMKKLRDNNTIKILIDNILYNNFEN